MPKFLLKYFSDQNSPYVNLPSSHREADVASPLNMERPRSSASLHSQHYDYSNQSYDDAILGVAPGTPGSNGAELSNPRTPAGSLVQSISPDGQEIMYHVTEVPDETTAVNASAASPHAHEDNNVLTTPMVREQMARSKLLKQQNKQRRNAAAGMNKTATSSKNFKSQSNGNNSQQQQQQLHKPLEIKTEQDPIDSMLYMYPNENESVLLGDATLISPNSNSNQLTAVSTGPTGEEQSSLLLSNNNDNGASLFDASTFIDNDMPTDLFEVSQSYINFNAILYAIEYIV